MVANPLAQVSRMGSEALTNILQRVPKETSGKRVKHVVVQVFLQDVHDESDHGSSFILEVGK